MVKKHQMRGARMKTAKLPVARMKELGSAGDRGESAEEGERRG
jgi:hypothetical protein